jgi:hypothetical protein
VVMDTDCTGSYKSNYHDHDHDGPHLHGHNAGNY